MSKRVYVTKGGVLVTLTAYSIPGGKVLAVRWPTGGNHGMLWRKNLRVATAAEKEKAKS